MRINWFQYQKSFHNHEGQVFEDWYNFHSKFSTLKEEKEKFYEKKEREGKNRENKNERIREKKGKKKKRKKKSS